MTSMTDGSTPNRDRRNARRTRGGDTLRASILGGALALLLTGCGLPDHGEVFLSRNEGGQLGCFELAHCPKLTDEAETSRYYQAIGAEDADGNPLFNLEQWKQQFGIASSTPIRAVYANKLDLELARNMNCWQPPASQRVVCYVSNYKILSPITFEFNNAVDDAIEGDINKSAATVAMVYDPNGIGVNGDKVAFYVFGPTDADGNQPLARSVALDYEGPKTVPRMCMSCHGGRYYEDTPGAPFNKHSVIGASFLPFDVQSYYFSSGYDYRTDLPVPPGFDLDSQQEAFRQLNALVLATQPASAIQNLINGLYSNSVNTPGATIPDDTFIPAAWDIDTTSRNLYRNVYRKYCRTCHVANPSALRFDEFRFFAPEVIVGPVCESRIMPHAEIPFRGLWTDGVARSDLKEYLKDVAPNGCQ
jgi:hypothetical protein